VQCFLSTTLEERRDCRAILRSTLHQVLKSQPSLISEFLVPEYRKIETDKVIWTTDTLGDLWPRVIAEATKTSPLTVVIDGFDEIDDMDQDEFFSCFKKYESQFPESQNLRLLILSRQCLSLFRYAKEFNQYEMKAEDTWEDIYTTVKAQLSRFADYVGYTPELQERVCREIADGARGMYLWATVMVAELEHTLPTQYDLKQQLESLPKELAELYDSILGRISKKGKFGPIVKIVLSWVAFQQELLKTDELGAGLALSRAQARPAQGRRATPTIDDEILQKFKLPNVKPTVFRLCGQLVKFSAGNVELVHRSLAEYLMTPTATLEKQHGNKINIPHHKEFYMDKEKSHATLGSLCVAYLVMSYFNDSGERFQSSNDGRARWEQKVRQRMKNHEFARYAALCWSKHLKDSGTSLPEKDGQRKLENPTTPHAICWTEVWWLARRWPRLDYPADNLDISDILFHNPLSSPRDPPQPRPQSIPPPETSLASLGPAQGTVPPPPLSNTPVPSPGPPLRHSPGGPHHKPPRGGPGPITTAPRPRSPPVDTRNGIELPRTVSRKPVGSPGRGPPTQGLRPRPRRPAHDDNPGSGYDPGQSYGQNPPYNHPPASTDSPRSHPNQPYGPNAQCNHNPRGHNDSDTGDNSPTEPGGICEWLCCCLR